MEEIRNVIVGSDFSSQAHVAVLEASRLAKKLGARLMLIHAIDELPSDARWAIFGVDPQEISSALRERAESEITKLSDELKELSGGELEIGTRIVFQKPSLAIVELAEELGDSLIVIGRTGETLLERLLLGSTAERVLRNSAGPTLVVASGRPEGVSKIVAPVDFSAASAASLKVAAQLAEANDAELHLVHAYEYAGLAQIASSVQITTAVTFKEEVKEQAKAQLDALIKKIGIDESRLVKALRLGLASEEIVNYASEVDADLIVMGAVGRRGVRRFLLGNTAERVVRRAPCSMLAVKPA